MSGDNAHGPVLRRAVECSVIVIAKDSRQDVSMASDGARGLHRLLDLDDICLRPRCSRQLIGTVSSSNDKKIRPLAEKTF
jgi:hypothetical protein